MEAGGLQSLLNLLDSTDDETCRRVAAGALANLAMNETNQELIMNAQGVHLLVGVSGETWKRKGLLKGRLLRSKKRNDKLII